MTVPVVSVVGHLRKGHRRAQHGACELLSAPGILGPDAHLVVRGEPTVAPAEHAAAQVLGQRVLAHEKLAMRHSSPSHSRWRSKAERSSFGTVNTYWRCGTGARTFASTQSE